MTWLKRVWNSLFSRRLDDEIQQEMATHLGMLEDAAALQGLAVADARARAHRQFGNPSGYAERTRDVNLSTRLSDIAQDIRFALRQMQKRPGFTAIAVLILAFGISSVTTIFSLVNAVMVHALPYRDPGQLVYLWTPNPTFGSNVPRELGPNYPDALEWEAHSHSFSDAAMLNQHRFNLSESGAGTSRVGAIVTSSFFATLGVQPLLGRVFHSSEDQLGSDHVVVISYRLWQKAFAGKSNVVGKAIRLDRDKYSIIGVMPEEFGYPYEGDVPFGPVDYGRTDLWVPLAMSNADKTDRNNGRSADAMIARLRPGVTVPQAQAELASFERGLNMLYPAELRGWTVWVNPLTDTIIGPVKMLLWILSGTVMAVLLIACGNVTNLLLAQTAARMEEMTVRLSLGAGPGRLVRQMLTESMVLSLTGCCLGVILSVGAVRLLLKLNPGNIPRFDETSVSWQVLLAAVAASILSGVLLSLAPAFFASRINLSRELSKGGSKGSLSNSRLLGQALIAGEVAMSFVLLIAAGLLVRSYVRLEAQNPGYLRSTLTMNLQLDKRYMKPEQRSAIYLEFLRRLRQIPGVIQAGAGNDIPLDHYESITVVEVKGFGTARNMIDSRCITPGYLAAFGMRMVAGRAFEEQDAKRVGRVVIVNQAFVRAFMGGRDPLTVQVRSGSDIGGRAWADVVGVVADRRHSTLEETPRPEYFEPYSQAYNVPNLRFAVESRQPVSELEPAVRAVLRTLDPELALDDMRKMDQRMADANARRRFQTILLSAFGFIGIVLALGGIYGVLSYSVRQRTREMGLRMVLGASRWQISTMVLKQGLSAVSLGLAVGIGGAISLSGLIRSWLYGVPASDPVTYSVLIASVLMVAAIACLIPATDAMRIDPAVAIRNE